MIARHGIRAVASIERQCLSEQFWRSRTCVRCFHASRQHRADEPKEVPTGNDQGTPYNAPNQGRTRQQRAAQLSEQMQMLAKDVTSIPSVTQTEERQTGEAQTVEAPLSTSPIDAVPAQQEDVASTPATTQTGERPSTPYPIDAGQAQQDVNDLGPGLDRVTREVDVSSTNLFPKIGRNTEKAITKAQSALIPQSARRVIRFAAPKSAPFKTELLQSRHNAGTIVGGNLVGAVLDHVNGIVQRGRSLSRPTDILKNLGGRRRERLQSFESKTILEQTQLAQEEQAAESSGKGDQSIQGLTAETQKKIIDRFVQGKYDGAENLFGKDEHANPAINILDRMLYRNPTFTARDGQRVRDKVLGLLPRAPIAPKANVKAQ